MQPKVLRLGVVFKVLWNCSGLEASSFHVEGYQDMSKMEHVNVKWNFCVWLYSKLDFFERFSSNASLTRYIWHISHSSVGLVQASSFLHVCFTNF